MNSPRTYRTGSPRDYLLGAALFVIAAWFAYEFLGAEHLRDIDRPIMATISALTFGGLGLAAIMRAAVSAIILSDDRVCVRRWTGLSRCFPVERLTRVVWSYRYAGGLGQYDQGRAWLELQFHDARGERDVAVVDYAGRSRHAEIEQLARDLAAHAGLSWDARSDPLSATDLPGAEIIWERRRGARNAGG